MTREDQIESLKAKLAASQRQGVGYAGRIAAIEAEIERLEQDGKASGR